MGFRILVVTADASVRSMLDDSYRQFTYELVFASEHAAARAATYSVAPNLVVVDDAPGGPSGLELTRKLRRDVRTALVPIIVLGAQPTECAMIAAFDAGADEYLAKPLSLGGFNARTRALLRRTGAGPMRKIIEYGELRFDPATFRLHGARGEIELKPRQLRIFQTFMSHPGVVFTRQLLLDTVWGSEHSHSERVVDVHVHHLRSALSRSGYHDVIESVRGLGYRLATPSRVVPSMAAPSDPALFGLEGTSGKSNPQSHPRRRSA